ncbi:hypothetical protein NA57DRAFT_69870 [Rhizodiscina lignyota]|uniref:N-acetyltransferase domain-containing protein n=1 Tax=Rhizodiscina lignyota TaxID=1504668 RepID=A0A9P4ILC6_9PEZI|nr:hypothetical protein NA57DRAFT_69870 [Rhizodiscina lignyota]
MAPDSNEYTIRNAESMEEMRDLWWPLMVDLGWNRAYNDAPMHWNVSRSTSWLVVTSKDSDKPEGCVVPFVFDNRTAWVGFFIMNASARGKGWGAALFRQCLAEFKRMGCEYIGLDAVVEQKATYERRGFREVGMIKNMFRDGLGKVPIEDEIKTEGSGWKLVDIRSIEAGKLVDFEERCTGFRRSRLWSKEGMFHRVEDDTCGFAATDASGALEGFVLVRVNHLGYRFGPIYASSRDIASALLRAAMKRTGELNKDGILVAEIFMDNPGSLKLFEELGWKDAGVDYHRMWIDAKATPQQSPGGNGERECWAVFDASEG